MILRNQENIKILKTISRAELVEQKASGINMTSIMVNALFDGIKTHTCRKSLPDAIKSQYNVGAHYYVRETALYQPETKDVVYAADLNPSDLSLRKELKQKGYVNKSSYYIPREFARIAILIKSASLINLHKLTHKERIDEGLLKKEIDGRIQYFDYGLHFYMYDTTKIPPAEASYYSFKSLWIKVHNATSWNENPIVSSIYFEPKLIID